MLEISVFCRRRRTRKISVTNLFLGPGSGLSASFQTQFGEKIMDVRFGCGDAYIESSGNFFVRQSGSKQFEDFHFAQCRTCWLRYAGAVTILARRFS